MRKITATYFLPVNRSSRGEHLERWSSLRDERWTLAHSKISGQKAPGINVVTGAVIVRSRRNSMPTARAAWMCNQPRLPGSFWRRF